MVAKEREPEIWKDIPEYEGLYQISSWGNVRSLDRITKARGNCQHLHKGKNIKINFSGPYPQVCLSKENKKKSYRLHILMADIFLEKVEYDYVVNHIDLDKCNNYYKNLEKINRRENQTHYFKFNYDKTSSYTGVSFDKSRKRNPWIASLYLDGKAVKIGSFSTEFEAYNAYMAKLKEYGIENKYAENGQS